MSENTILGIAQTGIQTGMTRVKNNAAQIASKEAIQPQEGASTTAGGIPTEALVEMKMNTYQIQASGKVVQAVDEILGSLLDEKA